MTGGPVSRETLRARERAEAIRWLQNTRDDAPPKSTTRKRAATLLDALAEAERERNDALRASMLDMARADKAEAVVQRQREALLKVLDVCSGWTAISGRDAFGMLDAINDIATQALHAAVSGGESAEPDRFTIYEQQAKNAREAMTRWPSWMNWRPPGGGESGERRPGQEQEHLGTSADTDAGGTAPTEKTREEG